MKEQDDNIERVKIAYTFGAPSSAAPRFGKSMDQPDVFGIGEDRKKEGTKADRYNKGRRRWSLVHFKSLEPMIEALEFGAKKYAPENWKKGLNRKEVLESIQRHVAAIMDGEHLDSESGLPHMGHIQCNAMFYNYMVDNNLGDEPSQY